MKKTILFILLILMAILIVSGCQENIAPAKSRPAAHKKATATIKKSAALKKETPRESDGSNPGAQWKLVSTFTGVGMVNTAEFAIKSDDWQATAIGAANNPPAADLAAFLRLRGDDPESMTNRGIVYATGSEMGSKSFTGAGTYFFHMHAQEGYAWTIKVEERVLKLY